MKTASAFVAGTLGLAGLQAITSISGSKNATGLAAWGAGVVARIVDPNVPLIPDLRRSASPKTKTTAQTTPAAPTPARPLTKTQEVLA